MGSELAGQNLKRLKTNNSGITERIYEIMFICLKCGKVFDEDEVKVWEEYRGEYWGMDAYETMSGCPHCQGDYEEAEKCESCGQYFTLDELDENHLCEDCREDTDE